jgi:hypothetical protein
MEKTTGGKMVNITPESRKASFDKFIERCENIGLVFQPAIVRAMWSFWKMAVNELESKDDSRA